MAIVVGLDVHRAQIPCDAVNTATGEIATGRIAPAERTTLRPFLRRWSYEELAERHGFNLDIWADVKDESLSDPSSLPAPEVIAAQIVEDATAGIEAFAAVAAELSARNGNGATGGVGDAQQDAVDALLPDEPVA